MMWVVFGIAVLYFLAIVLLCIGFRNVDYFVSEEMEAETQFSIIIPFRNEAENLPHLLKSLRKIYYPKEHFEIIFVDDASVDDSSIIISEYLKNSALNFKLLENTPEKLSPKKTAITLAISEAKHPWIITTDADCTVPENWLGTLNQFILKTAPVCVAMPVSYSVNNSFRQQYQQLDNWSLQAVTIGSYGLGSIVLSNGANFAYTKEAFQKVNGFEGNLQIASGDDMFLLEKFKRAFPEKISYLKSREAVVTTRPVVSWKQIIAQRTRWASKTAKQNSLSSKILGFLVFFTNLLLLLTPIFFLFWENTRTPLLLFLLLKILVDGILISMSANFFKGNFNVVYYLASVYVYAYLTVYVVISSFFGNYHWKGRSFRKQ